MPDKDIWELHVKTVKLSRSGDGSFGISIEGGADKGHFGNVGCVRDTVIVAQGDISPGDIILQVNGDAVGGFIHWDLLCEIRRSGSLLTLLLVSQGNGLPLELSDFLCQKFDEESEDFKLQKVVRHNIYNKTLPYTTRPPRVDEKPGLDYIFVSQEEFRELEAKGVLLEKGSYEGHMYGTPRPEPYDPNMHGQGGTRQLGPRQLGKLPPGWETAYTQYGQKYFINHNDGTTTWSDPRLVALQYHSAKTSKFGELPYGWEEIQNENGVYYIDYINKRTTTQHPGALQQQQQQQSNDTMLSGYGSPVQVPGRIVTATLYKTTKGFGFTLSGGDKSGQPVLIKSVKQGSPADTQGRLMAGDILVKVNGQIVSNLTHTGVVQLFKAIPNGSEARLELRRNDIQPGPEFNHQPQPYQPYPQQHYPQQPYPQQQPYQQQTYQPQPIQPFQQQPYINGRNHHGYPDQGDHSSSSRSTGSVNNPNGGDLIPIYIDKGDNGFGFTIHQSTAGQRIKTIMDRSRCAYLMEGDLIVQINSEPLVNKSHGETVHLLKSIPPRTRTLLLISRSTDNTDLKRKDKKNRSFRSRQPPPPPPPPAQPLPPNSLPLNNHVMTSANHVMTSARPNPLTQPRMPLTVPVYGMDSNRISDHGSVQSGSDRQQQHQLWESPVRSAGSGGWDPVSQPGSGGWDPVNQFNQSGGNSWDGSSGEYQDVQVNLQKDNNGFGFKVIGGEEQGIPVAIGHVTPEGPAEGLLQIYDEIRSVNGQSVLGAYHTGVLSLIGQAAAFQGKISLVVRRHKNPELLFSMAGLQLPDLNVDLSRYKLVNMRNVTVTKGPDECFGFVIHSSLRAEDTFKIGQVVADSPAGRCADLMEGDSVLTVNGTPITGLQHTTVVELIKKCGVSVILGVGTPQLVEEDEDCEWRNQTEEIKITLERDERGFGFSIRGGKAFQEEDTLFVLRIGKGGVADRDGRLRRGDEIIEINGQSMYEVSHQEAVDKIKSGGSTLNLVVRRRKLEMPPIIQLGLEDKPETLQYPERTEIKSDSRSKSGDTPEKDLTPGSSPAPTPNAATPSPDSDLVTRDQVSRDLPSDSLEAPVTSRDDSEPSRDVVTPRGVHDHEYDTYEPEAELGAGSSSPVD